MRWCNKAVNRSCFLARAAWRTPPNPWDTRAPLCVGRVCGWASFSLVCALPSAGSAEVLSSLFVSFIEYYGAVRPLQNVHVRMMALSPSRTGLLAQTLWRSPGSRAHCVLTCLDSSTTPSPAATRDLARRAGVAFPLTEKGRHPVASFRSSMIPPASPLSTLRYDPSRVHRQDSRPEWSRFSFSVGLSHPLQCAGLSRLALCHLSFGYLSFVVSPVFCRLNLRVWGHQYGITPDSAAAPAASPVAAPASTAAGKTSSSASAKASAKVLASGSRLACRSLTGDGGTGDRRKVPQ